MTTAVRLSIYGKVQGVGFRYYTRKKAIELLISGWVKNMTDGSVYVEAEGEQQNLETFVDWCQLGPEWAHVRKVDRQDIPVQGFKEFVVK